jgi:hypothetical protein
VRTLEEHLVARIHPEVSPLWAVADGDGLFRSDEVARLLAERGINVLIYDDPVAFRFLYEHEVRPQLESQHTVCVVIVVDPGNHGLRCLPADIYEASRHIEVALGDLFPKLSRKVLRELEPSVLAGLWSKRDQFPVGGLGERDTADLVLRIAYRIEPSFLNSLQELVYVLVGLHFEGKHLPEMLAQRVEQVAGLTSGLTAGLDKLIRNSAAFWQFMQAEWENWIVPPAVSKVQESVDSGIRFDDSRLRVWMDNLFLEGFLRPVENPPEKLPRPWCVVGVARATETNDGAELSDARDRLVKKMPSADAGYEEWLHYAQRYSAYVASAFSRDQGSDEIAAFWRELWTPLNERFTHFVESRLESLCNLPPTRPILLSHIARYLTRRVGSRSKVALLVLDGLSLAQWGLIREELLRLKPDLCSNEEACFSLVPSITNVARQSIYSGELPVFFDSTIERTDQDAKRWKTFWDGATSRPVRSAHMNIEGKDADLADLKETIGTGVTALGITVRMPDEIVHGSKMGWRGVAESLRLWARHAFLEGCVTTILDAGYEVYVTSDHGNLEATGEGSVSQGVLAERSGQRVRIYRDQTILTHTAAQLGKRVTSGGSRLLPANYMPLVHSGRGAFVPSGQTIVSHGGMSLDEMVVPFIQISRATRL